MGVEFSERMYILINVGCSDAAVNQGEDLSVANRTKFLLTRSSVDIVFDPKPSELSFKDTWGALQPATTSGEYGSSQQSDSVTLSSQLMSAPSL
jgi:hypothetical protein